MDGSQSVSGRTVMTRVVVAAVLVSLWASTATAGDVAPPRFIDLDRSGALEALRQSNPAHYEKVRKIIDGVITQPDARVPGWMRATFDARDVSYAPIVMTSHPPKRRLSFALDDVRYETVVTLTNVRGEIVPLR
jgi:hypothetical protein